MSLDEIIIDFLIRFFLTFNVPSWVVTSIIVFAIIVFVYLGLASIIEKWKTVFAPIFYNDESQDRGKDRRKFANSVLNEIDRLNEQQQWEDEKFAELEADIEVGGRWKPRGLLYPLKRMRTGDHREKSLSKALESSHERLILMEGDPGSGKSVALRHITHEIASKASRSNSVFSLIPIYVNLRGLIRSNNREIDRQLIYDTVLSSINRIHAPDLKDYLAKEFDRGMKENTWLFLFDSFDEIPDVLSSIESDDVIRKYSDAIADFMSGLNQCRCVLASRNFRGPSRKGWTLFRILPLSEDRQVDLIKKTDLSSEKKKELIGGLPFATPQIKEMSSNPMFLELVCEYVRTGNVLPANSHQVYESFVSFRLDRDAERLKSKFGFNSLDVRNAAEDIAFCMTADPQIGLKPTREQLRAAMSRQMVEINTKHDAMLDAIESLKLGSSSFEHVDKIGSVFEFLHRRFQEYFATCYILKHPNVIIPREMLLNHKWRESCITLLQTQKEEMIQPILVESTGLIISMIEEMNGNEIEFVDTQKDKYIQEESKFYWYPGFLHILGVLQDGLGNRIQLLSVELLDSVGLFLIEAWSRGILLDKKWVLEKARVSREETFLELVELALNSKSQWLRNIAYRQLSRAESVNQNVEKWVRGMFLELINSARLIKNQYATYSYLARLPGSEYFLTVHQQLIVAQYVDKIFFLFLFFASYVVIFVQLIMSNWSFMFLETMTLILMLILGTLSPLFIWNNLSYWSKWDWRATWLVPLQRYTAGAVVFSFGLVSFFISLLVFGPLFFSLVLSLYGFMLMWAPSLILMLSLDNRFYETKDMVFMPFIVAIERIKPFLNQIQFSAIKKTAQKIPTLFGFLIAVISCLYIVRENSASLTQWFMSAQGHIWVFLKYAFYVLIGSLVIYLMTLIRPWYAALKKDQGYILFPPLPREPKKFMKDLFLQMLDGLHTFWVALPNTILSSLEQIPLLERRKFIRWKTNTTDKLPYTDFLIQLVYFDHSLSSLALEYIFEQRLVEVSWETEKTIREFIVVLENIKDMKMPSYRNIRNYLEDIPGDIGGFFLQSPKNLVFLIKASVDYDFLDKLNQLLEYVWVEMSSRSKEKA